MTNSITQCPRNCSYNPASQIASITRNNDSYAWNSYYNVNRPYTANGLNQLTSAGAVSLGYDGQGNLNLSGVQNYTYTSENRLASAYNWSGTGKQPFRTTAALSAWP